MTLYNYYCDEVKRIIDGVSPNYPQLTTYEKEWLYFYKYGYIPGIPVDLEYQEVMVNPTGTVHNAIPFPYKSAILTGQTLVNISKSAIGNNSVIGPYWSIGTSDFLKPNTKYFCWVKNLSNDTYYYYFNDATFNQYFEFSIDYNQTITRIMTTKENPDTIWLSSSATNTSTIPQQLQIMLIEYQEGMENWDIPYFEGMQSVKMPVLKITGKNLFNGNIAGNYYVNTNGELVPQSECYSTDFIEIIPNTTFSINSQTSEITAFYDKDKNFISWIQSKTFLSPSNAMFLRTTIKPLSLLDTFQLEIGTITTPYEPHKSNILTVNEDVELRGIGDMKDELNLLTGEMTQRVGKVVLDGSEEWLGSTIGSSGTFMRFNTIVQDAYLNEQGSDILCDRFNSMSHGNWDAEIECIHSKHTAIHINIPTSKLESNDISGFKKWLSSNPVTVYYRLATESVKTVDLTILDKPYEGTNHYHLTANITCEAILEVPVVSTGEQTLQEINND